MDLGNRGGGDRGFVEGGIDLAERPLELGLDRGPRRYSRKGRQAVLQAGQVGADLLADEVGAGRRRGGGRTAAPRAETAPPRSPARAETARRGAPGSAQS